MLSGIYFSLEMYSSKCLFGCAHVCRRWKFHTQHGWTVYSGKIFAHSIAIRANDRSSRPRVRDYLVRHQDITFDEYTDAFSLSFEVNWPYDDALVIVKEETEGSAAVRWRISPVFQEHIRNMRNWTVGPRYSQFYPPMGKAVSEDIEQFGT